MEYKIIWCGFCKIVISVFEISSICVLKLLEVFIVKGIGCIIDR